jgi:hypothetical protein
MTQIDEVTPGVKPGFKTLRVLFININYGSEIRRMKKIYPGLRERERAWEKVLLFGVKQSRGFPVWFQRDVGHPKHPRRFRLVSRWFPLSHQINTWSIIKKIFYLPENSLSLSPLKNKRCGKVENLC